MSDAKKMQNKGGAGLPGEPALSYHKAICSNGFAQRSEHDFGFVFRCWRVPASSGDKLKLGIEKSFDVLADFLTLN